MTCGLGYSDDAGDFSGKFKFKPGHCVEDWTFFGKLSLSSPGVNELVDKQIVLSYIEQLDGHYYLGEYYLYIPAVWYHPELK